MDPIANMLTSLRNASLAGQARAEVPYSKLKEEIAKILVTQGFLERATQEESDTTKTRLVLELKYRGLAPAIRTIRRVSSPGLRVYAKSERMPRPRGGFGILVVSTPHGLMTSEQARRRHTGGEVLCEVIS